MHQPVKTFEYKGYEVQLNAYFVGGVPALWFDF